MFRFPADPRLATRAGLIERSLAEAVMSGRLRPGQRLDEQALAAEFTTSRTPVRDALRQLAASGLVEIRPRRGAVVACPDGARVRDGFALLTELEALCARWSALRMTPRERARFDRLHRDMAALVRAGDQLAYRDANAAWHDQVYAGAHNDWLRDVARDTTRRLSPYRRAQFATVQRLARSHAEHAAVVDCVMAADAEGAALNMARHIRFSSASWEALAAGHDDHIMGVRDELHT